MATREEIIGLICYGTAQGVKMAEARPIKAGQHIEAIRNAWLHVLATAIDPDIANEAVRILNQNDDVNIDLDKYREIPPYMQNESSKP